MGLAFALLGAALAVGLPCAAAGIGISWVQSVSAKVVMADPDKFAKTLVLQLIPTSSGLYGFVVGFMVLLNTVMSDAANLSIMSGLILFAACLPVALTVGGVTLYQSKVCEAGVKMVARNDELSGRALTMSVITELFNLFGFIISILSVMMLTSGDMLN
ncbi:MAG: hypothetical protein LBM01_01055 [Christensenellaceae bacterium]|nr:hypothetical protein [Christensenellaceae bacterium]